MARMIDADAMLAELKPVDYEAEHSAVLISDMSKIMREWVERQPTLTPPNEWVSVEERLPTIEKDYGGYGSVSVNVFNGKSVLPMDYESSVVRGKKVFRWKYPWNRIYDGEPITHWRPLPEPPKKEA